MTRNPQPLEWLDLMAIITETTRNIKVDDSLSSKDGRTEIINAENKKEGKNSSKKLEEENTTARGNSEAARANKEIPEKKI